MTEIVPVYVEGHPFSRFKPYLNVIDDVDVQIERLRPFYLRYWYQHLYLGNIGEAVDWALGEGAKLAVRKEIFREVDYRPVRTQGGLVTVPETHETLVLVYYLEFPNSTLAVQYALMFHEERTAV